MIELLYFILGIGFAYIIEPLLEKLMQFILTLLDVATGNLHIQLTQQRKIIEQIQEDKTPTKSFSIGFAASIEEEMEDEKDEPDDG